MGRVFSKLSFVFLMRYTITIYNKNNKETKRESELMKKFLLFFIVLIIAIAGFLLINTDERSPEDADGGYEVKLTETEKMEETDPLIYEARKAVQRAHQIFLVSSEEEVQDIIRSTWSEPELVMDMYGEVIDWILARETPIIKVDTKFANETITSTEHGEFITYTATVTVVLYNQFGRISEKTYSGIFNIVKDEERYIIQNLQLLEPAKLDAA